MSLQTKLCMNALFEHNLITSYKKNIFIANNDLVMNILPLKMSLNYNVKDAKRIP